MNRAAGLGRAGLCVVLVLVPYYVSSTPDRHSAGGWPVICIAEQTSRTGGSTGVWPLLRYNALYCTAGILDALVPMSQSRPMTGILARQ